MSDVIKEDKRLIDNLHRTAKEYIKLKLERRNAAKQLYETFLRKWIFNFDYDKSKAAAELNEFFGKDRIRILAVDGTMKVQKRRGMIVFYAVAAPLLYELDISADHPKFYRVEEETTRHSIMIMIPVPLTEIYRMSESNRGVKGSDDIPASKEDTNEVTEDDVSEELEVFIQQRRMGKIDAALMRLAETYAVLWSLDKLVPDVIMFDGSLFEMYSYTNWQADKISLYDGEVAGTRTKKENFMILKSMPTSSKLEIPSRIHTWQFITAEILEYGKIRFSKRDNKYIFPSKLAGDTISISRQQLGRLAATTYLDITMEENSGEIDIKKDFKNTEQKLCELFFRVCKEGFDKNNLDAFRIYLDLPNGKSYLYMGEGEIQTITRIGLNLLIKNCWDSGRVLFSVTKDSGVRFLVDNFLAVGGHVEDESRKREKRKFDVDLSILPRIPSTDSAILFDITLNNEELVAPISTLEFDPAISGVYRRYDPVTKAFKLDRIAMIPQERQFLRSLVQIAQTTTGRKSYVFTIDRITYPQYDDEGYRTLDINIDGGMRRFMYYESPSKILKLIIHLAQLLSSNRHDAVFGYPDPLFEADQYVKTIGLTHNETLEVALTEIDLDEFSLTYRQLRERGEG